MLQRILNSLKKIFQKVKDIMGEYSKKLHIRKNGTVEDITLYTSRSDLASSNALSIRDNGTVVYAPLGSTSDSSASSLRVRKNGTTYAIVKNAYPTGSVSLSISSRDSYNTKKITLPPGTKKVLLSGRNSIGGGSKYIATNGQLNIIFSVFDSYSSDYEIDNYDMQIYYEKNSGVDRYPTLGEISWSSNMGKKFSPLTGTLSWSPAINNS